MLWCRSHLVWLVFEGSIPTCAGFHLETFFVTCIYAKASSILGRFSEEIASFNYNFAETWPRGDFVMTSPVRVKWLAAVHRSLLLLQCCY